MNATLITAFLRQRLTSPARMVLLAFMFVVPLMVLTFAPMVGLGPLGDITGVILVLAAGAIGQDVSSGVLHLLLARPVTRTEYVISRWVGIVAAAWGITTVQLALGAAILGMRSADVTFQNVGILAAEHLLVAVGIGAVLVLFSSVINGIGDLGIYFVVGFSALVLQQIAGFRQSAAMARVATEIQTFLVPKLDLQGLVRGDALSPFAIASYLSTVTLCIALAIVVMNRKELSYASG